MTDINTIYIIKNNINNKVYVGQTWISIKKRLSQHKEKENGCLKLRNAMNAYGRENFLIEALVSSKTQENADFLEIYFISLYDSINNGYNIKEGGSRGKQSEETKQKISKRNKGKVHSEISRKNMSDAHKGQKPWNLGLICSEEVNEKNRQAQLGKKASEETKKKMSLSRTGEKNPMFGKHFSEEAKKNMSIAHLGQRNSPDTEFKKGITPLNKKPLTNEQILLIINDPQSLKKIAKNYKIGVPRVKKIKNGEELNG